MFKKHAYFFGRKSMKFFNFKSLEGKSCNILWTKDKFLHLVKSRLRGELLLTPFLAELIGTFIIVVLGVGVAGGVLLRGTKSAGSGWLIIALGWGLAYAFGNYAIYSYSGAHLNPALTLGLASIGQFGWNQVPIYILGQLFGAVFGAVAVFLIYLPHWKVTAEAKRKLLVFVTSPALSNPPANLFSEMIGTFIFVLGILTIKTNSVNYDFQPLIIGFIVTSIGLSLGGATGFAINPARDLGPRIAHYLLPITGKGPSDWKYAWIPIVGPIIGGTYGALFYQGFYLGIYDTWFWVETFIILLIISWIVYHDKLYKESTS